MHRAHSLFVIRSADEDRREITGIATTPSPDRYKDVVIPEGAEFDLPIPFLWQHDQNAPIGHVVAAEVTASGIEVDARIARVSDPGIVRDRLDEAWHSIRAGLLRGLSIGFRPVEGFVEKLKGGGSKFKRWLFLELSAVTVPANAEATIQSVKAYDIRRAHPGAVQLIRPKRPGVKLITGGRR